MILDDIAKAYAMEVAKLNKEIIKLKVQNEELMAICKDFLETNELKETWLEEMHSTIEAAIKE
jgi:hypothetical protein